MIVPVVGAYERDFDRRLTFVMEGAVLLAVRVLEGMLGRVRYIPCAADRPRREKHECN